MVTVASALQLQRVEWLQKLTIVWMTFEVILSLAAAWRAHSPALIAFGGDSAVELLSAIVVLRRFRSGRESAEQRAARAAGALLFVLAAFIALSSATTLLGYSEPKPSYLGIAVLLAAAVFMPWLAKEKRQLASLTGSAALRADAAESALCAYLSVIALAGLALNALWHLQWADPVAGLAIMPLVVREGFQAMRGKPCGCC